MLRYEYDGFAGECARMGRAYVEAVRGGSAGAFWRICWGCGCEFKMWMLVVMVRFEEIYAKECTCPPRSSLPLHVYEDMYRSRFKHLYWFALIFSSNDHS
jgi:hypothetical protein